MTEKIKKMKEAMNEKRMRRSELCELAKKHENRGEVEKAYQCYLEAALTENDAEAMYALGQMYFEGDYVRQDYNKAGNYCGKAYDNGADIEPWTLIMAGNYWETREPGNEEYLQFAKKYYKDAADLGVAYGYECLGKVHFESGEYDKAYENLIKMEERNPCGFYYLGRMYDGGLGVKQDVPKAIDLYKKAVDCGYRVEDELVDEDAISAQKRLVELQQI